VRTLAASPPASIVWSPMARLPGHKPSAAVAPNTTLTEAVIQLVCSWPHLVSEAHVCAHKAIADGAADEPSSLAAVLRRIGLPRGARCQGR